MKNFKEKGLILFSCLFLTMSCIDINVPDPVFEPKFNVNKKEIYSDIKKIANSEDVWMEGYKFMSDSSNTSLNVQLINPINLPKNEDSVKAVQMKVAGTLKKMLVNLKQFEEYNIIFIKRDTVRENFTTITSETALSGYTFKEADL